MNDMVHADPAGKDACPTNDGLTRCKVGNQLMWISDRSRGVLKSDDFTPDELRRIAGEIEAGHYPK